MSLKLIVSDIDGTLLNSQGVLDDYTAKTIMKLKDKPIHFGLATGRNYSSASRIAREIGLDPEDILIISLNGLDVRHPNIGYEKFSSMFSFEETKKIVQIGLEYYMGILYFFEDKVYFQMDNKSHQDYYYQMDPNQLKFFHEKVEQDRIKSIDEIKYRFNNEDAILKIVFVQDPNYMELIKEDISKKFSNDISFMMVSDGWAEIMPESINKGDALLEYLRKINFNPNDVMTFGDSDNDLTLIDSAGWGVAMGNARNSLKLIADDVCGTNNDFGLAKYIEDKIINNNT